MDNPILSQLAKNNYRHEYHAVSVQSHYEIDQKLNEAAKDGWYLHSMIDVPNHFYLFIMEREVGITMDEAKARLKYMARNPGDYNG